MTLESVIYYRCRDAECGREYLTKDEALACCEEYVTPLIKWKCPICGESFLDDGLAANHCNPRYWLDLAKKFSGEVSRDFLKEAVRAVKVRETKCSTN